MLSELLRHIELKQSNAIHLVSQTESVLIETDTVLSQLWKPNKVYFLLLVDNGFRF